MTTTFPLIENYTQPKAAVNLSMDPERIDIQM